MGAKTRSLVVAVFVRTAFAGAAMAAQIAVTTPGDDGHFAVSATAPIAFSADQVFPTGSAARPSPVPLPTSLALIGSSLVVLALVGATL